MAVLTVRYSVFRFFCLESFNRSLKFSYCR